MHQLDEKKDENFISSTKLIQLSRPFYTNFQVSAQKNELHLRIYYIWNLMNGLLRAINRFLRNRFVVHNRTQASFPVKRITDFCELSLFQGRIT